MKNTTGRKMHIYTLLKFLIWKCIIIITTTTTNINTRIMKPWSKIWMKSMSKLICQKRKIPFQWKDQNHPDWCCTWWKTLSLKLLIQVKILKGDNMWRDGNYTWTSSLKAFSRGSLRDLLWQTECSMHWCFGHQ